MQGYNSYFVGDSKVLVHNCEIPARGNFRQKTIKDSWDGAKDGSKPNTKKCPTCDKDVEGNPNLKEKRGGEDGWDASHNPSWSKRDNNGKTRKEQLDNYNEGVSLECKSCNRSGGNNDSRFDKKKKK